MDLRTSNAALGIENVARGHEILRHGFEILGHGIENAGFGNENARRGIENGAPFRHTLASRCPVSGSVSSNWAAAGVIFVPTMAVIHPGATAFGVRRPGAQRRRFRPGRPVGDFPPPRRRLSLPRKKGSQRFYQVPGDDVFDPVLTRLDPAAGAGTRPCWPAWRCCTTGCWE